MESTQYFTTQQNQGNIKPLYLSATPFKVVVSNAELQELSLQFHDVPDVCFEQRTLKAANKKRKRIEQERHNGTEHHSNESTF